MIIKCKNATIEIVGLDLNTFTENIKKQNEKEFFLSFDLEDNNEYVDYVVSTNHSFEYLSVDDIVFDVRGSLEHINHHGFGDFRINIYKKN